MTKWICMSLMTLGMGFQAQAQMKGMGSGPCAKDVETLCANVEHGEGRIMKCLHENKDKLSAECKAHQEKMKETMKEMKESCHDDAEKFCHDVKAGKGRMMKCMREHKEELSSSCKEEMKKARSRRKAG